MTDDELTLMVAVVRQVQMVIGMRGLRMSEAQQARVLYYVVKGLQDALRPAGEHRWQ